MKKLAAGVAVFVSVVGGGAGAAFAHVHAIDTPGEKQVTMPCEPFHGTTPGQSQHSANWDSGRGLHPIHWGLHMSPSSGHRAIEVVVLAAATCP